MTGLLRELRNYERADLIPLTAPELDRLRHDGVIAAGALPGRIPALTVDGAVLSATCSRMFKHADEWLWDLLSSAYVVDPTDPAGLRLLNPYPLRDLLPRCIDDGRAAAPPVTLRVLFGPIGEDEFGACYECFLGNVATEEAARVIRAGDPFLGTVAECCDPNCGADFAWVERDVCLIDVHTISGAVSEIRFFPWRIARPEAANVDRLGLAVS